MEVLNSIFLCKYGCNYNNYSLVSKLVWGQGIESMLEEVKWAHQKCFKSRLDQQTSAMISLVERLVGKGMG